MNNVIKKPIGNKVIVKMIETDKKIGDLIIVNDKRFKQTLGKIIEFGTGDECVKNESCLNIGDKVVVEAEADTDLVIDGILYKLVNYSEVLATVE